jgi:uncharacterized membrane protein
MNPSKPSFKTEIVPLLFIIAGIPLSIYFYLNFPEQVPVHWNYAGEADNWASRGWGAFLFPVIAVLSYLLFLFLPYLDPKKERYSEFRKPYHIFKGVFIVSFFAIYLIAGLSGLGYEVAVDFWIPAIVGLLFIVIGNYFGKIKSNWFMGIRTPWTLSSEEVWNKTHRFGGKMFMFAGLIMMLMYFIKESYRLFLLLAIVALISVGTIFYSYIIYIKEKKKNDQHNKLGKSED